MRMITLPKRSVLSTISQNRYRAAAFLALGLSATVNAQGFSSTSPINANGSRVHVYSMHLLREDLSFSQPVNQWVYYFKMAPGIALTGSCYLDLEFDCSETIRPGEGTMSVLLNGKPVASHKIGNPKVRHGQWRVQLPTNLFKEGFNDLRLVSRQIAIDGPCKDVDFSANWVRISKSTTMHLERAEPTNFPLAAFPFPYLDTLEDHPIQAYWTVPENPKPSTIGEALGMASDWGRYEPARLLPFSVIQGQPRNGQNILIGGAGGWNSSQSQDLAGDSGAITVAPGPNPGQARLGVSGKSDIGLRYARQALGHSEMVAQMRGAFVPITSPPASPAVLPTTRMGTFTFSDLGMTSVRLSGAYKQVTTITIQRPVRCDLGRDSYISLHFRHSANLNPLRSSLNISINGVPFSSTRLTADNANGDTVKARLPVNELSKNLWQIDIMAYHDLASIDCSKSYDDVAYTVIDGDSTFEFGTGALAGRPFLDAFPYLVGRDGLAPDKVSISLPGTPSNAAMSVAATIAGRAAQMNRKSFDWDVNLGSLPNNKNNSLAIGYYQDASRFASLGDNMLVRPIENNQWKVDPRLQLLTSSLSGGAVLQAVQSPWADTGVVYVLLAADDAAMDRVIKVLSDPAKVSQLTGQVAVFTNDGQIVILDPVGPGVARTSQVDEMNRYTPTMIVFTLVILVAMVAGAITIAKQFVRRPPQDGS